MHSQLLAAYGLQSPTDPNWANVASLLHFNGTSGSTTFTDQTGKTWTAHGSAQILTASPVAFGGYYSGDGSGYISTPSSSDFNFGSGVWTVEFIVKLTAASATYGTVISNGLSTWQSGCRSISIRGTSAPAGQVRRVALAAFGAGGGDVLISTSQLTVGNTYRIRVVDSGTAYLIYINGALDASGGTRIAMDFSLSGTRIGGSGWDGSAGQIVADIDELRVTKGVARSTGGSYVVDTAEFPNA